MKVGILGAGNVGSALAALMQPAGHEALLGARRDPESGSNVASLETVAQSAELVVLAVSYSALADMLPPLRSSLAGKVVGDATNPVAADWSPLPLGPDNSAAEEVSRLLPESRVVKAFNTVFADNMVAGHLVRHGARLACFIASDDAEAASQVAALATSIGFDAIETGALSHARHLEALAHLNIALLARNGMNTSAAFLYDRGSEPSA